MSTHTQHTSNVNPVVGIIQLFRSEGHFDTSPPFLVVCPARLGHEILTTVVDVHATVGALCALSHDAIEKAATVVTPGRTEVGVRLELVRDRLLGELTKV